MTLFFLGLGIGSIASMVLTMREADRIYGDVIDREHRSKMRWAERFFELQESFQKLDEKPDDSADWWKK